MELLKDSALFMVLDGSNLMQRALHAHRHFDKDTGEWHTLTTKDGRESGALYGAIVTLSTLVRQFRPTHLLWCSDFGQSTARLAINSEYKANRIHSDYDLSPQYEAFEKFLDLAGIRHYKEQGVEADDIIAAAAIKFSKEMPVVIVSADHDLRQLVSDRISVLKPSMGSSFGAREVLFTPKKIVEHYGIESGRLSDVWALTGDSGDNLIGIKLVGEKTAIKMLNQCGTLIDTIEKHPKCRGWERRVWENYKMIHLTGEYSAFNVPLDCCEFDKDRYSQELLDHLAEWELESVASRIEENSLWYV
jgi:DNA polymerase-1